jgi:hypothetical protein
MRTAPKPRAERARVLLDLQQEDLDGVDRWAERAGGLTRAAALRLLVRQALRSARLDGVAA